MTPLDSIRHPVAADIKAVHAEIIKQLHSKVPLIQEIGQHIVNVGGKQLRPLVVLLTARALGYTQAQHITVATIIEFIHTATLLHDDVVDNSALRRGQDTANAVWGNEASVLVGDFIYSRAFQLIARLENNRITAILAEATNKIAEGEVLQLLNRHNSDTSEQHYLEVIRHKTATLFEAAAKLGAVLSQQAEEVIQAMAEYGECLGIAFQLIDDAMDYLSDTATMGKNTGDDLAEGKPTLPLIYALQNGNAQQIAVIKQAISEGKREYLPQINQIIAETQAIAYTKAMAHEYAARAKQALAKLPATPYRDALIELANFAVSRDY